MPTGKGLDSSFEMGFDFGRLNIAVVSGLAAGIDSAAHAGNTAGGEKSVAVLGCGPDRIYPASNRKIALDMLERGGALVSEYPPGTDPQRFHFPERNRIISGLSRAVIVVEAPGKSGALITADFALEQGRDLYVHSNALSAPGNRTRVERLVFDGAPVIDSAGEVLADWYPDRYSRAPVDSAENEPAEVHSGYGRSLANMLDEELQGYTVKFNGKYFRSVCNESAYFVNS
jgi:DNA processing protein